MDYTILNKNYNAIDVFDEYESIIWADRFNEAGDFEIYTRATSKALQMFKADYFIQSRSSDHIMIIQEIKTDTDAEEGNHLTITGLSLESILQRRIVWDRITLSGKIQDVIRRLIDDNLISPSDSNRKIENFIFEDTDDEVIDGINIEETQFYGTSLYEIVVSLCQMNHIGFRIFLNADNQLAFRLYSGTNRSYTQEANPIVEFSKSFDNLVNSDYNESKKDYKNVIHISGGNDEKEYSSHVGEVAGLDRREIHIDANDISLYDDEHNEISEESYKQLLTARANEELNNYKETTSFETEVSPNSIFVYGTHYFLGDIVEVVDEYGHKDSVQVTEYITSESLEGISSYPTLSVIKEA